MYGSEACSVEELASTLTLGDLLQTLMARAGGYELLAHWQQGEFHHDVVLEVQQEALAEGVSFLVVSTNCNGGVKEVLALSDTPDRAALWRQRCEGEPPKGLVASSRTVHWFDPCELLRDDARSEILPEHRRRQEGGGWELIESGKRCGRSLLRLRIEPRRSADARALCVGDRAGNGEARRLGAYVRGVF